MTTFSIQLHEALDGKCFSTKELVLEHNDNLAENADEDLRDIIKSAMVCDDEYVDDIMDMLIENKEQVMELLKFL